MSARPIAHIDAVRPSRLVRASSQKKLDRLLKKTAALIAKDGFNAMTMRDLSTALGMSLAGLYHYFASKEDLLFQLQYRTFVSLLEQQEKIAEQPGTPDERLARLLTGHLQFYWRHTNELKACTFEMESLGPKPYKIVEEIRRRYYRLMASVVAQVIDGPKAGTRETGQSRHAALFIFGMLNWIFMWYDPSRHGSVEDIGQEMRDLLLNGLRRTKRSS
ncbi:MAG TPA: TetR/AcrR family transcriptional regulator [Gemmatimonadaceae bacterium]